MYHIIKKAKTFLIVGAILLVFLVINLYFKASNIWNIIIFIILGVCSRETIEVIAQTIKYKKNNNERK